MRIRDVCVWADVEYGTATETFGFWGLIVCVSGPRKISDSFKNLILYEYIAGDRKVGREVWAYQCFKFMGLPGSHDFGDVSSKPERL